MPAAGLLVSAGCPAPALATPPAPAMCTGEMPDLAEDGAGRDGALRLCCAVVSELVTSVLLLTVQVIISSKLVSNVQSLDGFFVVIIQL